MLNKFPLAKEAKARQTRSNKVFWGTQSPKHLKPGAYAERVAPRLRRPLRQVQPFSG